MHMHTRRHIQFRNLAVCELVEEVVIVKASTAITKVATNFILLMLLFRDSG